MCDPIDQGGEREGGGERGGGGGERGGGREGGGREGGEREREREGERGEREGEREGGREREGERGREKEREREWVGVYVCQHQNRVQGGCTRSVASIEAETPQHRQAPSSIMPETLELHRHFNNRRTNYTTTHTVVHYWAPSILVICHLHGFLMIFYNCQAMLHITTPTLPFHL